MMQPVQRLPTSGARAVAPFCIGADTYLAVPQLAADVPGQAPSMTAGDSDTDLIVYRWVDGGFIEHQRLPVPGGEDAEFFSIGERHFLATASLRSGAGPYSLDVQSVLYEWHADGQGGRWQPFQSFDTYAAKQWTHFSFDGRHFLALAQGVAAPDVPRRDDALSAVFEWTGERFELFQAIESAWGYNWHFLEVEGRRLLAYADHVSPSRLLQWNGATFEPFQVLEGASGRAFAHFESQGALWLAFARLLGETVLCRWEGGRFVQHQVLSGPGGRELLWLPGEGGEGRLLQVNFILGSREAPRPVVPSVLYGWRDGRLEPVAQFETFGGTDAASFEVAGVRYVVVSNSLDATLRFRVDSCVYQLAGAEGA
jgi:hypothetical protein